MTTLCVEVLLNSLELITLKLANLCKPLFLHTPLAIRTFLPTVARALVAADVDVLARENLAYFIKHVLEELESRLASHAEYLRDYAPYRERHITGLTATEIRI